jgi:hypothetical protein
MKRYIALSALLVGASQFAHGGVKDFDSLGSNTSATAAYRYGGPFIQEIGDLVKGALPGGMSHAGDALIYYSGDASLRDNISFNLYTDTIAPTQIESVTKTFQLHHGFNVLNWSLDDGANGSVLGGVSLGKSFYWTVGFNPSDTNLNKFGMCLTQSAPLIGAWDDSTKMYINFGVGLEAVDPNPSGLSGYQGPIGRVEITATPEPSSLAVVGVGALGFLVRRRRK